MQEIQQFADLLSRGGLALFTALLILGGLRRWYVFGWVYSDKVREAEDFKALAKAQTDNAEKITQQAERAIDLAERMQSRRRMSDAHQA